MDAVVMRQQNRTYVSKSCLILIARVQHHGDVSKIEVRTSYGGWLRIVATICYKALVPLYWSHKSLFRFMQPRQNRKVTWINLSVYRVFFSWVSYNSCWTNNTNQNTRNISETLCLQYFTKAGHRRQTGIRHQVASFLVETSTRVWQIVYRSFEIVCK